MILALLKRALKATLHEAVEEWAAEVGLPRAAVDQARSRRLALAAQAEDRADDRAAAALEVDDEPGPPPALALTGAACATADSGPADVGADGAPASEDDLMAWVHRRRRQQARWADVARAAAQAGHDCTEEALRGRYRRWRAEHGQGEND